MPIATVGTPFSMRETVRGEQVARSATWAILRFLRSLARLMCYGDKFLNLFLLKSALVTLLGVGDIKCYYIIHKADILHVTNNIVYRKKAII